MTNQKLTKANNEKNTQKQANKTNNNSHIELDIISKKDIFNYNYDFFKLMSDQRIQMLQFYITIVSALIAAFGIVYMQENDKLILLDIIILIMIICVSMAFLLIEIRATNIIRITNKALKLIEDNSTFPEIGVIHQENAYKNKLEKDGSVFILFVYRISKFSNAIKFLYISIFLMALMTLWYLLK